MTSEQEQAAHTRTNLEARREALKEKLWQAAIEAGESDAPETLTDIVRLKADIQAIEYVLELPQFKPVREPMKISDEAVALLGGRP